MAENSLMYEISYKMVEDTENFIFTAISDFCENLAEMRLSKEELTKIIKDYKYCKYHDLVEDSTDLPLFNIEVLCLDNLGGWHVGWYDSYGEYWTDGEYTHLHIVGWENIAKR